MSDRKEPPELVELRAAIKAGNVEDLIGVLWENNPWALERIALGVRFATYQRLSKEHCDFLDATSKAINAGSRVDILKNWADDERAAKKSDKALAAYETAQKKAEERRTKKAGGQRG